MIDLKKNHVYIITVKYLVRNGEKGFKHQEHTFTSLHSISSKVFEQFLDKKIKQLDNFVCLEEECGSQYTVPLSDFCK